jgi:hypothetical protein
LYKPFAGWLGISHGSGRNRRNNCIRQNGRLHNRASHSASGQYHTVAPNNAGHRFYDFDSAQPGHPAGYCSNALAKRAKKSVSWLTTLTFPNIRHTRVMLIKSPNWVGETHVRLLYLFQWGRV